MSRLDLINSIVRDVNEFAEKDDFRLKSALKCLAVEATAYAKETKAIRKTAKCAGGRAKE